MNNYRFNIEELILSCFLNQDRCNELDKIEFEEYIIPYELFKTTHTHKLVAKAIFVLQEDKNPVSDITVINFIESKTKFNEQEMLVLLSKLWCTFDTMTKYIKMLKEIDNEESKLKSLEGLI